MLLGEQRGLEKGMQKGTQRGILLSGRIFQAAKGNPALTDVQIAEEVGCTVEEVENVRKMFDL